MYWYQIIFDFAKFLLKNMGPKNKSINYLKNIISISNNLKIKIKFKNVLNMIIMDLK